MKELSIDIVRLLRTKDKPLTAYTISKLIKQNTSSVYNELRKLEKKGIVIGVNTNRKKYYILQPFFYDSNYWVLLIESLKPVIEEISDKAIKDIDVLSSIYISVHIMTRQ